MADDDHNGGPFSGSLFHGSSRIRPLHPLLLPVARGRLRVSYGARQILFVKHRHDKKRLPILPTRGTMGSRRQGSDAL
jgi:hypothetical protein